MNRPQAMDEEPEPLVAMRLPVCCFRPGRIILLAPAPERPAPEVCYVCPDFCMVGKLPGTE
ncbi:hypothetical protein TRKP33_p0187 (plasmid) [Klebsiella pneumoniae]|nr:hypothetical protein TRKP33_p0187 [Klebsiella pneumoniae]